MEKHQKNFKLVTEKRARVILPNIFTLVGVCIGLSSIKFAFDNKFEIAIIAIIAAAIIDGLDGRIARLLKGTSKVGKELDSLTDVISFGVAPAFIMYFWSLNTLGRVGWLICLAYVDYNLIVPSLFVIISILLISKIPTYSFKKIVVPRRLTIFLLLGVILYFGILLIYTFNAIVISALIYMFMIPLSYFHFNQLNKNSKKFSTSVDDDEDIL